MKRRWNYECIARNLAKKNNIKDVYDSIFYEDDLLERKFGKWKVIKRVAYVYKKWRRYYLCRCDCGKESIIYGSDLRKEKTRSCLSCAAQKRWKDRKIFAIKQKKEAREYKKIKENEENSNFFKYYPDE